MSATNDRRNDESANLNFNERIVGGQHDRPCRACIDADSWIKLYGSTKLKPKKEGNNNSNASTAGIVKEHKECPLDKDVLGRRTWSFLHTMAAYYPENPAPQQQKDMKDMMHLFSKFYPCDFCAKDFRKSMKKNEPDTSSQSKFSQWLCQMHNEVNRKIGKPEFDCSLVNERWKDGWKDGSCD